MLPANLREKLYQVQEELTSSLRMLVLAEPISSPLTIPSRHGKYFEGIRLDAGADLLNYYQFQWCRMREASDKNYHLAEQVSKTVLAVESYITEQHKLASALTNNLASVSLMMNQLQKITDSLATTEKVFSETEQQLAILEDLMKDVHLEDEIKEYDTKLACLQEQKFEDLQKLKNQLSHAHLQKVKDYESRQILKAKERQAIFEEAFETEILQYKQSGILPRASLSNHQTASLEDIQVDDDPSSLNEFLNE